MQKIILAVLLVALTIVSKSQTTEKNLKLVEFKSYDTLIFSTTSTYMAFTVPQNRIWKIQDLFVNDYTSIRINGSTSIITVR